MTRQTIRYLFVFFMIWLPVQYGLIGLISQKSSEPWPAFIFPGFKNVFVFPEGAWTITYLDFELCCDPSQEVVQLPSMELFSGIPRSQSQGFLRSNFGDSDQIAAFDDETRTWLKRTAEELYPDYEFRTLDAVWNETFYSGSDAAVDSVRELGRVSIPLTPISE